MTGRKRFFYNGALLTVVGLSVKTVNLLYSAFVSREIGAEALGLFTLIGSVYSFAVTFATSGINLTVTRLVASALGEGREGDVGRIMKNAVLYALIFSGAATLVLLFGAEYFASSVLHDARAELPLRALAFSLVPIALSSVFSGYFIGVRHIVRSSAIQVLSQIIKIALSIALVLKMADKGAAYTVAALCISTTLSEAISFVIALIQYLTESKTAKSRTPVSRFHDVSSMALPLAASAYIRSALLTLEHVLIPARLRERGEGESEALSSYGVLHGMALPAVLYPMSPLSSFAGLLVPEFAESQAAGDKGRVARITEEVISATLSYSAPAAVFMYLFSEELGYILYSSYDAGFYIAMLAPVLPIMYLDHVTDAMLKGIGEQVYSMWVNISDSLLSVILIWFLIPPLGIAGYAVVIIAMEGYNFLLSFVRLKGRVKFRMRAFLSGFSSFASAFAAAFLADSLFAYSGELTSPVRLVLKLLFALCAYLAIKETLSLFKRKKIKREAKVG